MRRGITLVEMLVAMAITLLLMATVVQVFDLLGTAVANSRTSLEMNDRLRQARDLLQTDLSNISRPVTPWVTDHAGGYFEYIEGPERDRNHRDMTDPSNPIDHRFGDRDDILMFTARSDEQPYQGRAPTGMIESPLAEIIWSCVRTTTEAGEDVYTIHRRVLLIAPWASTESGLTLEQFQQRYDLSARVEGTTIVLNSLADLALRENRYRHRGDTSVAPALPFYMSGYLPLQDSRLGEDILLYNALAFDVRIFDRGAPLYDAGGVVYGPSDPGPASPPSVGTGAYVDLGYLNEPLSPPPTSEFSARPRQAHASADAWPAPTFDTWPAFYGAANAFNGLDDTNSGLVDIDEHPYQPPYSATPAGIQVKLRAYEPDGRQIREVTVIQAFN